MNVLIDNYSELATTNMRADILDLIEVGISAVSPQELMDKKVHFDPRSEVLTLQNLKVDLKTQSRSVGGRLFVIGAGKAAGAMAEVLEEIIPESLITAGVVICNNVGYDTKNIRVIEGSHPVPDQRCVAGTELILDLKNKYSINNNDLVICLLSGGGSALLTKPASGLKLEHEQSTIRLLLESGADITEINAVRKHISSVKGGRLGAHFAPARVVSLIISDITGNPLDAIASGPTTPDPTTFDDALAVLLKYDILDKVLDDVRLYLLNCQNNPELETPKKLDNCTNFIIGDNQVALAAMFEQARKMGYEPLIINNPLRGDPVYEAKKRAHYIKAGKYSDFNLLLMGGETTPKLPTYHGQGGRNQHYAAISMLELANYEKCWCMASGSTDGADNITGIAGAIVDESTLIKGTDRSINIMEYIEGYNTNTLFEKLGNNLIRTHDTKTNVGDLVVYII